ncbi:reverse transcriptase domain-containing protein [Tanacetum coccineum]
MAVRYRNPSERLKVQDHLRYNERHVLDRRGHRRAGARFASFDDVVILTRQAQLNLNRTEQTPGIVLTVEATLIGTKHRYRSRDRDCSPYEKRGRESESPSSRVSESGTSDGGHWKSRSKRHKSTDEDDLAVPWIWDPEDHVKNFQAAAQVERWAMPTWCHMFNSTLIGAARVWFNELPPESIDGYKDLKAAFIAYFMQQKKYINDPIEIYNIKQIDGETIEEFMERFKVEKQNAMMGDLSACDLRFHA